MDAEDLPSENNGERELFSTEEEENITYRNRKYSKTLNEGLEYLDANEKLRILKLELGEAVASADISRIANTLFTIDSQSIFENNVASQNILSSVIEKAEKYISNWKGTLAVHDAVDVYSPKHNAWYEAKIIKLTGSTAQCHYIGWSSKFDEDVDLKLAKVFPKNVATKPRKKPTRKSKESSPVILISKPITSNEADVKITETKYGRKSIPIIKHENKATSTKTFGSKQKRNSSSSELSGRALNKGNKNQDESNNDKEENQDDDGEGQSATDRNEWLCSICHHLDAVDQTDLLLCDGPCLRSFHLGCLNLESIPVIQAPTQAQSLNCVYLIAIFLSFTS